MNEKLPDAASPSGFRRTLLKSAAAFRALAAFVTALAALGSGVHLALAPVQDETVQQLAAKWKWMLFGSALIAGFMVVFSMRFYFCLRAINTERRRRGTRLFIITCVVMAILELAVCGLAFSDSQSTAIKGGADPSSVWVSLVTVYCLCLLLVVLEIVSIIIALTCVRAQLYEQIATVKESKDVVEFERRPSSVGGVDENDFSIEKIDDDTSGAEAERQPLQQTGNSVNSTNATETMLVNNELYGVPQPGPKRPKQIPPPLPPVKSEEVNSECAPPIPTSPIPDEVDQPASPKSPTFPHYERQSRGSTPGTSPMFPRYVDTRFAYYDPQLGTFARPHVSPDGGADPSKQQEASQLQSG